MFFEVSAGALVHRGDDLRFLCFGNSGGDDLEGGGQWGLGIYFVGPVGDSTGRFEIVGIVKDGESMEGRVRKVAAHLAAFALGIIEYHGRGRNAAPEGVDTPPPELLTGVGGVFLFPKGDL